MLIYPLKYYYKGKLKTLTIQLIPTFCDSINSMSIYILEDKIVRVINLTRLNLISFLTHVLFTLLGLDITMFN